jgi:hypothetical protein
MEPILFKETGFHAAGAPQAPGGDSEELYEEGFGGAPWLLFIEKTLEVVFELDGIFIGKHQLWVRVPSGASFRRSSRPPALERMASEVAGPRSPGRDS